MPTWLNKKDEEAYQAGYASLYFKDQEALIAGFIREYASVEDDIRSGIENPLYVGLPPQELFIRWLSEALRAQILYLGFHRALSEGDWDAFHCAQFSVNRLAYQFDTRAFRQDASGPWGSGWDRSSFAIAAITAMGACDLDLAKAYLPEEDGLAAKGFPFNVQLANLLMCVLYRQEQWIPIVARKAEKACGTKGLGAGPRTVLRYWLALLDGDWAGASNALQMAMDGFRKADWLHDYRHPLSKFCPRFVYGLYFSAQRYLAPEDFARIRQPEHVLWKKPYVAHCAARGFRAGEDRIPWPEPIAFLAGEMLDLDRYKSFPVHICDD